VEKPYTALQMVTLPKDANPQMTMLSGKGGNALYATLFGGAGCNMESETKCAVQQRRFKHWALMS
jgi:hypothetical protein